MALANLSLLAVLAAAGTALLRLRYRGAIVPILLGVFLYASPIVFYGFHLWVEVFWAPLVALTTYALVRAAQDRRAGWAVAGAALVAVLVSEKVPSVLLVAPLAGVALWRLRTVAARAAMAATAVVVFGIAVLPYLHHSGGSSWNPYGGERYYAGSEVPFDVEEVGTHHRVPTDETFSLGYVRDTLLRDLDEKVASTGYTLVGRHTGLLPFTPLALFLVGAALASRRADAAGWAVLAGLGAYLAFYVTLFPHNYNGGGQTFGNRYFLQAYPVVLALPALFQLRVRTLAVGAVLSAAIGVAAMWPHYFDARHAIRDIDRTSWLMERLPFEANQDGANYFRCGQNVCEDEEREGP